LLFLQKKTGLLRFLFPADAKTVVSDGAILYKQYALNVGIRKVHGRENEIGGVTQRKRMIGRGQLAVLLRVRHGVVINESLLVGYRNVFHGTALAHSVEHLPANAQMLVSGFLKMSDSPVEFCDFILIRTDGSLKLSYFLTQNVLMLTVSYTLAAESFFPVLVRHKKQYENHQDNQHQQVSWMMKPY
jgi:hypothetical protein